jgi:hypothetical protein
MNENLSQPQTELRDHHRSLLLRSILLAVLTVTVFAFGYPILGSAALLATLYYMIPSIHLGYIASPAELQSTLDEIEEFRRRRSGH